MSSKPYVADGIVHISVQNHKILCDRPTLETCLMPLTDVPSKWSFLDAICSLQGVAGSNMWLPFTCNDLLATVYLQWFTCGANVNSIEMIIASSLLLQAIASNSNV